MPLYINYNLAYTHLQPVPVHMLCCEAYMNLSHMQKYLQFLIHFIDHKKNFSNFSG